MEEFGLILQSQVEVSCKHDGSKETQYPSCYGSTIQGFRDHGDRDGEADEGHRDTRQDIHYGPAQALPCVFQMHGINKVEVEGQQKLWPGPGRKVATEDIR